MPERLDPLYERSVLRPIIRPIGGRAVEHVHDEYRTKRYRKLFTLPDPNSISRYGARMRERSTATEADEKDAADIARYATERDPSLRSLYQKYMQADRSSEDLPRFLRETPEFRIEVGTYLLDKIATLRDLPERVAYNAREDDKNPNFPGYDFEMGCQEYATLLALAMLDGTFKADRSEGDPIEMNSSGEVVRGQHRYAAFMLLGIHHEEEMMSKRARLSRLQPE